jgi:hypothetical protein
VDNITPFERRNPMRTFYIGLILMSLGLALVACKKKEAPTDQTQGSAPDKPSITDQAKPSGAEGSGPFAGWNLTDLASRWQGAWVVGGGTIGTWEAWYVKGTKVTTWDGRSEKTLDFTVTSPCTVKTTEKLNDGSSSSITHFAFSKDKLLAGLGESGLKKGDEAIACVSNFVATLDAGGACQRWEPSMFDENKWEAKPVVCKWAKEQNHDVLSVNDFGTHETKLFVYEGVLVTEQMMNNEAQKFPDFAAAKAARNTKK